MLISIQGVKPFLEEEKKYLDKNLTLGWPWKISFNFLRKRNLYYPNFDVKEVKNKYSQNNI